MQKKFYLLFDGLKIAYYMFEKIVFFAKLLFIWKINEK